MVFVEGAMSRDHVFASSATRASDFEFNAEVAAVFDDMLVRSIPFYGEQQSIIREVAQKFYVPGTRVYDLGCSTASTLIALGNALGPGARLVGYDNSEPMLERARINVERAGLADRVELRCADLNGDLADAPLENASVVTVCWTLQFVRPLRRDAVMGWINRGLVDGGALVVAEKILTKNSDMNRYFIELYYDFKRRNGYSEDEILRKREALENVLIPYRMDENAELFRRNGFPVVETFFQCYNFAAFLGLKTKG
jgi:tRNA (cmo5U34)-methyltransferase